jgi:UDP-N-acetylglucosamine 2-epimerase
VKVVTIVGARPQFIKAAPVSYAIEQWNGGHRERQIQEVFVHTGQHYDYEMSQIFFEELALKKPDYHLGVGSGTHAHQTGEMLKGIEAVLLQEKPALVIVYGDTNSTMAGAIAAAKLHIPVAHVEAGLRSFNKRMPEEINRVVTDHVATWLFCPTETAVRNLEHEGITEGVYLVVDVMYESLLYNSERAVKQSNVLERLGLRPKQYIVATVHRAENTERSDHLGGIMSALVRLAERGWKIVFPVHPRTRKVLEDIRTRHTNLLLISPLSYFDMLALEKQARVILTDSGGVQKEAYWCRVPCVTLREETEWVETVTRGGNRLAGVHPQRIVAASLEAADGALPPLVEEAELRGRSNGTAIVEVLIEHTAGGR